MLKGFTTQPKGITAKPSGTQKNSDSSRPIGPTTKPKRNTAKLSGTLKTSEPERPGGHTAQPKGTTAKLSGKTAQPKGNTAKPSGITKHQDYKNRPHTERQNTILEIKHQSTIGTKYDDLNTKGDAQGQYSKAYGEYSKALGRPPDAWHARHWPTGRFVDSGGRVQRAKKKWGNKCFCFKQNDYNNSIPYHNTYPDPLYRSEQIHILKIFLATKPVSVSWGTPPSGEPGEPRPTGLRTLSSQQRGATNALSNHRLRNHNRGIRSPDKVLERKNRAKHYKRLFRTQAREYRTRTPLEARHSLARCVSDHLFDEGNAPGFLIKKFLFELAPPNFLFKTGGNGNRTKRRN